MRIPSAAVIIASLAVASTTFSSPITKRIIGGEPVKAGELPFVVLFKFSRGGSCTGFLIGPNTVVTAAHCLDQSPHIRNALRSVEVAGMVFKIEETKHIQHPRYKSFANDIGLVFLPKKVPVPYPQVSGDYPQPDSKITAAGFGSIDNNGTYPKDLYKVELIVDDKATCQANESTFRSDTQFCTKDAPQSVCHGDSGGPLFIGENEDIKVVGITSHGTNAGPCGVEGNHQYFTFVHPYKQWINEEISRFEKNGTASTAQDSDKVKEVQHPQYKGHANDIGLVFLPKKVLARYPQISGDYPQPDSKVTAAGFGTIGEDGPYPKGLRKVALIVGDKATCQARHSSFLRNVQFCAKDTPQAVCYDDSGGPVFTGKGDSIEIVGIANHGSEGKCGSKGNYQYFTFVHSYMPWINEEIARFEKNGTLSAVQDS
ncbi:hypothetical protein BGZ72_005077 [Mortierella alpina]|nr:hypothetical protein BGZ72_005077 [Mortierella alpina]